MSLNVNGYYPCFRGNESQINDQANNGQVIANQTQPLAMQPQLNADTVELSGKKDEKTDCGMSTGAKVAIGTGVVAGLAVAADYIFAKGKHVKGILNSFKKNSKAVSEESRSTAKAEESIPQNIEQHTQDIPVKTNKSETIKNTIPEETKGTQDSQAIKPKENVVNNVEPKKEKAEEATKIEKPELKKTESTITEAKTENAVDEAKISKDKNAYNRALKNIQKNIERNKQVDEIMANPGFKKELEDVMNIPVKMLKGETELYINESLLEAMNKTIRGAYDKPIDTLYHGTNSGSYKDILEKGFSLDSCRTYESGKGIYFSLSKDVPEKYSPLKTIISAKYTGGKVAEVEGGAIRNILYSDTGKLFEEKLGITNEEIRHEIILRQYNTLLQNLGYDAIHTTTEVAGCEYCMILDPKNITIIK